VSVATPLRSIVEATRHEREPATYVPQYGLDDGTSDGSLVVVPLSNWGKHRLYVNTADGDQVGWIDLDTGERSLVMPGLASEFEAALQSHDGDEDDYQPRRGVIASAAHARTGAYSVRRFEPTPIDPSSPALEADPEPTPERPEFSGKRAYSGWELGAAGEHMVAEELDELVALDPRWAYINSIPVGTQGSDIDHLVVGPGGVFTINARHHHGGRMWVDGDALMVDDVWQHDVPDSRLHAERAGKLLSATAQTAITARALIVPVGVAELTVNGQPIDVQVVEASGLVDFLISRPAVLDAYTIALVLTCARLSSTWRPASTTD